MAKIELKKKPCSEEKNDYELIVDYRLVIDTQVELVKAFLMIRFILQVERDFWQNKEEILTIIEMDSCSIKLLELWLNIRESLAPQGFSL